MDFPQGPFLNTGQITVQVGCVCVCARVHTCLRGCAHMYMCGHVHACGVCIHACGMCMHAWHVHTRVWHVRVCMWCVHACVLCMRVHMHVCGICTRVRCAHVRMHEWVRGGCEKAASRRSGTRTTTLKHPQSPEPPAPVAFPYFCSTEGRQGHLLSGRMKSALHQDHLLAPLPWATKHPMWGLPPRGLVSGRHPLTAQPHTAVPAGNQAACLQIPALPFLTEGLWACPLGSGYLSVLICGMGIITALPSVVRIQMVLV